ncbi:hypothetical protein OAC19_00590 [Candidatus Pelagibacter sp.]|nr:hypothetical protein [Candidatus Pelagibacter sp.]
MKQSHTSSNYFFRKSPSHYHMMLLVMSAHKLNEKLSVEGKNYSESGIINRKSGELVHEITIGLKSDNPEKNISFYSCT